MGLKSFIASLLAIFGFISAFFFFWVKKYNYAFWIIIFSLGSAIGGSFVFNESLVSIHNSFNGLKKEVGVLKDKVATFVSLKQQVTQNVEVVTKVEKEISNIAEVISQQYGKFTTEKFTKEDIGEKLAIYPHPSELGKDSTIFIELQKKPVQNSVSIFNEKGENAPPSSYSIASNIINIHVIGLTPDKILKSEGNYFEVKYIPNLVSTEKIATIKDLEIKEVNTDGEVRVEYKVKEGAGR